MAGPIRGHSLQALAKKTSVECPCGVPSRSIRCSSPGAALAVCAALLLPAPHARAAGTRADYERANKLPALTRNKVFRSSVRAHWSSDGSCFWYRNELPGGAREFIRVDAPKGARAL